MSRPPDDGSHAQVPFLPGERFDLALDARRGVVTSSAVGDNILTVTTHRAILVSSEPGKRTTALLPLSKLTGIEVVDVYRANERLPQGLLLLALGAFLAWLSWTVVGVVLVSLLLGGLPALAAIYMLTGYALPDQDGALVLHAGNYSLRHVLRSADARRDAYLVAHRLYELAATAPSEPVVEEHVAPEAEQAPLWPPPEPVAPVGPTASAGVVGPTAAAEAPSNESAPGDEAAEVGSTAEEAPPVESEQMAPERGTAAPPSP